MKKATEVKYQSSANLFQFCRRVLDHKFGGIRVIDQDVGHILGFDPADCSHWKKGKKNIRSIQAMKSIAEHLGVDERLVVDVASGEIDESEAYEEFFGYGAFHIDQKVIETAKKDYYKRNAGSWTREKEVEFKAHFELRVDEIEALVSEIHATINFSEAPLYLPEVAGHYQAIKLLPVDLAADADLVVEQSDDQLVIKYPGGRETRPYMRFKIAKAMSTYFFAKKGLLAASALEEHGQHLTDVRANIFASRLLTPAKLIRREIQNVLVSRDVVHQLAEVFWVSKAFMNNRLKEILQNE
jgi:hypothetical protein